MRYFLKNKLVLFICFLSIQLTFSQTFSSTNFSTLNGLPNNSVFSIKKDSRGILWVGTGAGVSKIRNNKITNFYEEDGLAYNNCWAIEEDANHNLWFGSYGGGVTFYDGNNFSVYNTSKGLVNNYIRKIFYHNQKVFIGTKSGLSVIDINSKEITNPVINNDLKFQVMGFFEFEKSVYIQTYRDGLWKYNEEKNQLVFLHHNYDSVFSIFKNKDLILVSFDGFFYKDKSIKKYNIRNYINDSKPLNEFGNSVFWNFVSDRNQNIYGVADGINYPSGGLFNLNNNAAEILNSTFNVQSTKQWSLEYDSNNNVLFIGTLDKGLFKVDLTKKVTLYNQIKNIIDIEVTENTEYYLSEDGLHVKGNTYMYIPPKDFYSKYQLFFDDEKLTLKESFSFARFKNNNLEDLEFKSLKKIDNTIWVNTTIGLFKVAKNNTVESYFPFYTNTFYFTSKNNAFFQTPYSKVYLLKDLENNIKHSDFELENSNNPRGVTSIIDVNNNLFFLSRFSGLYQYHNGEFKSFIKNNIWKEKELIYSAVNNNNQLIISNSKGEVFFIKTDDYFEVVNKIENSKIIGNTILFLKSYKEYLIIGTEKGINLYRDNSVIFLDEEQGITNKLFSSAIISNDNLLIGTDKGYYKINLKTIINNFNIKPYDFSISNIKVNYKDIPSSNYNWSQYTKKSIKLPYKQNTVSFSFNINNHPLPNKLKYRYKIASDEWSQWTSENTVQLNHLNNGDYNITGEIKDYSNGKTYSSKLLSITITPPFWKTWWFISLIPIVLFLGGYILYRFKINRIKKEELLKQDILKRVSETKMEALQSQMNPHFIFNAMNSIQNFIIDNDIDNSLKYMGEFSKLIRKTLHNSSLQYISLAEEISYLKTYIELEKLRFETEVTTTITADDLALDTIGLPPMLLQPIIENVFKHAFDSNSKNPKLTINFTQNNGSLVCEVIDNGKGVDYNNSNKQSKGTKLIEERLQLLNYSSSNSFSTVSIPLKGTIVTITLKIYTLNN